MFLRAVRAFAVSRNLAGPQPARDSGRMTAPLCATRFALPSRPRCSCDNIHSQHRLREANCPVLQLRKAKCFGFASNENVLKSAVQRLSHSFQNMLFRSGLHAGLKSLVPRRRTPTALRSDSRLEQAQFKTP